MCGFRVIPVSGTRSKSSWMRVPNILETHDGDQNGKESMRSRPVPRPYLFSYYILRITLEISVYEITHNAISILA